MRINFKIIFYPICLFGSFLNWIKYETFAGGHSYTVDKDDIYECDICGIRIK